MINTVTENEFINTMTNEYNNFSIEGSRALFNYLEELENSTNKQINFDPIDLRCTYSEYENLNEIIQEYESSYLNMKYGVHKDIKILEDLQNQTQVIKISDYTDYKESTKIIIQNF